MSEEETTRLTMTLRVERDGEVLAEERITHEVELTGAVHFDGQTWREVEEVSALRRSRCAGHLLNKNQIYYLQPGARMDALKKRHPDIDWSWCLRDLSAEELAWWQTQAGERLTVLST